MDVAGLRWSWNLVAQHGDQVPLYFYSELFLARPDLRVLFPASMSAQRDRLVNALGTVVSQVDNLDVLVPVLQQLGRDHRKFQVLAEYYPAVGDALLATLAHFTAEQWTKDLAEGWAAAYMVVAKVMTDAAKAAETTPAWWEAEIVGHERRTSEIAVLTLRPDPTYPYVAGQSVALEYAGRPKLWRYFSPANAPRSDGTFDIHVRLIPGGQVSPVLVYEAQCGDVLRLGSPIGDRLTLASRSTSNLLLIAGGSGLAPLKAVVEQRLTEASPVRLTLVWGVDRVDDLYDTQMGEVADKYPELHYVEAVAARGDGHAVDAAVRLGVWHQHDIYVCGSDLMVAGTVERLLEIGTDPALIHYETLNHPVYGSHAA